MKLNELYLSTVKFGPAQGARALFFSIGPGEDDNKETLFEQMQKKLDSDIKIGHSFFNLRLFYNTAIDGSHRTYLCFLGGEIDKKENFVEFAQFASVDIAKDSLKMQKDLKINIGQLSPPFLIFQGKPQYLTGSTNESGFYQLFNCVTGVIKNNDKGLNTYNKLSAQEILNHQFGAIVFLAQDEGIKWDSLFDDTIKQYGTKKIYICDVDESPELWDYCLISGIRYQEYNRYA